MVYVLYAGRVYKGTLVDGGVLVGALGVVMPCVDRKPVLLLAA